MLVSVRYFRICASFSSSGSRNPITWWGKWGYFGGEIVGGIFINGKKVQIRGGPKSNGSAEAMARLRDVAVAEDECRGSMEIMEARGRVGGSGGKGGAESCGPHSL